MDVTALVTSIGASAADVTAVGVAVIAGPIIAKAIVRWVRGMVR